MSLDRLFRFLYEDRSNLHRLFRFLYAKRAGSTRSSALFIANLVQESQCLAGAAALFDKWRAHFEFFVGVVVFQ